MDLLDTYHELYEIKKTDYKRLSIVRNEIDQLLYLKRELIDNDETLYRQIKDLESDYFPKIHSISRHNNKIVLIEEFINAPTLDVVMINNQISKDKAIDIMIQVCLAVKQLHHSIPIIIHRDIKPENIFYDKGKVYLFDFDISRNYKLNQTKDTIIMGSVGYAAPEQFGFGQSDQRSDIYALGVLFNKLLTNQMIGDYIYNGKERSIIEKATHIDPSQRYQNIEELLSDLQESKRYSWLEIPGFRSSSIWKKTISSIGYLLLFYITATLEIEGEAPNSPVTYLNRLLTGAIFISLIAVIGNYMGLRKKCFFQDSPNKWKRIIGVGISCIVIIIVILFIASILTDFLKK